MESTKLKAMLLGLACMSFVAAFAQDSSKNRKTDTTKWHRHDSTSMNALSNHHKFATPGIKSSTAGFALNTNAIALKKELENQTSAEKYFAGIHA